MKTNGVIALEYGSFRAIPVTKALPRKYKPSPVKADYDAGIITRTVVVRRNDETIGQEIDPSVSMNVDTALYRTVNVTWRISGKRDRTVVNGIIEDFGVAESNSATVKKLGQAVERILNNPLEFWRGY